MKRMRPGLATVGFGCMVMGACVALVACLEDPTGSNTYRTINGTDGKQYEAVGPKGQDWSDGVTASGAHDLRCPKEQVEAHWVEGKHWVAEGCGQRAKYVAKSRFGSPYTLVIDGPVLASSTPVPAPPPLPASPATSDAGAAGCTKDIECKGARICIAGACQDPK